MITPGSPPENWTRWPKSISVPKGPSPPLRATGDFLATLCVSINEEIVHGIPGQRKLKEGDIVSLDVGVNLNGYFGDAAITLPVGEVDPEAKRLLEVTEKALCHWH